MSASFLWLGLVYSPL